MFGSVLGLDVNVENSSSQGSILIQWGLKVFGVGSRAKREKEVSTAVLIFVNTYSFMTGVLLASPNPLNYSNKQSSSTNPLKCSQVKGIFVSVCPSPSCMACVLSYGM